MLDAARTADRTLPILFATGQPSAFSHWGFVTDLAVVELHRATWETVLSFTPLEPCQSDLGGSGLGAAQADGPSSWTGRCGKAFTSTGIR